MPSSAGATCAISTLAAVSKTTGGASRAHCVFGHSAGFGWGLGQQECVFFAGADRGHGRIPRPLRIAIAAMATRSRSVCGMPVWKTLLAGIR